MQIISKFNKIKTIPLKIVLNKLFSKAFSPFSSIMKKRKMDKYILKYQNYEFPNFNLTNLSQLSSEIFKNINCHQILITSLKDYLEHNFDIFSFEKINVNLEENNFLNINREKFSKTLLTNYIPDEFQNQSKDIISLIDQNYKFIDWQSDLKKKYKWNSKVPYNKIKFENAKNADIKFPWELSRFKHLPILAAAIDPLDEKTIKYQNEIVNELLDFIAFNPPTYGVNWKSPMEIAIRSFNIIISINLLTSKNILLNDLFLHILSNYLYFSAVFIWENIEWSNGLRNNHYFANLLGLIAISKLFPEDKLMNEIYTFSIRSFSNELLTQFNEDGSNFEGSIPYHFFMIEILYYILELTKDQKNIFSKKHINRISSILEFSKRIIGNDGFIPQIGDNDSGKIIDYRSITIFNDKYLYYNYLINNINLLISNNNDVYLIKQNKLNKSNYNIFKDIGIFIYENKLYKIWVSLGRIAQFGKGGHNHFDLSSFVCEIKSQPIFVDPGTYCYTSEAAMRDLFRSSNYHNRFSFSPPNQLENTPLEDLFWLFEKPADYSVELMENYLKLKINYKLKGNTFQREYIFEETQFQIIDKIPKELIKGEINFHLDKKINKDLTHHQNQIEINDYVQFIFDGEPPKIEKYYFSAEYGLKEEALRIKFNNLKELNSYKVKIIA